MKYGHGVSIFTFATSTSPQTWPCPLACWTYNDEYMGVERKGGQNSLISLTWGDGDLSKRQQF